MMLTLDQVIARVLQEIAARPDGHQVERLQVDGLSDDDVEGAVMLLLRDGLIGASYSGQGGGARARWWPSSVTAKGREFLSTR